MSKTDKLLRSVRELKVIINIYIYMYLQVSNDIVFQSNEKTRRPQCQYYVHALLALNTFWDSTYIILWSEVMTRCFEFDEMYTFDN